MENVVRVDTTTKFTLTSLTDWLNRNCQKEKHGSRTNESFTVADVQGYIRRGSLPPYIKKGSKVFVERFADIPCAKLYRLKEVKLKN